MKNMNREELIADFKEFLSENLSLVEEHITRMEDISLDTEWLADEGWDVTWEKTRNTEEA